VFLFLHPDFACSTVCFGLFILLRIAGSAGDTWGYICGTEGEVVVANRTSLWMPHMSEKGLVYLLKTMLLMYPAYGCYPIQYRSCEPIRFHAIRLLACTSELSRSNIIFPLEEPVSSSTDAVSGLTACFIASLSCAVTPFVLQYKSNQTFKHAIKKFSLYCFLPNAAIYDE
jgi:hypothetical protein